MNWNTYVKLISPYIVKITTKNSGGTGFLAGTDDDDVVAISTADHVIKDAYNNNEAIEIVDSQGTSLTVAPEDGLILSDPEFDVAVVTFKNRGILSLPQDFSPITGIQSENENFYDIVGVEVGWIGYPGGIYDNQCFFSGRISSFIEDEKVYLLDGTGTYGISGGPVFCPVSDDRVTIIGTIIEYRTSPTAAGSPNLPGLSVATAYSKTYNLLRPTDS